jgi:predicted amidohydrolase YtcJ
MELVVEDAVFVTMAADAGPADCMLIRDDRIAAIGPAEAVRAAAPAADVVRLGGATVIPGLIDGHCHVADVGYLATAADCGQPSAPATRREPIWTRRSRTARPCSTTRRSTPAC